MLKSIRARYTFTVFMVLFMSMIVLGGMTHNALANTESSSMTSKSIEELTRSERPALFVSPSPGPLIQRLKLKPDFSSGPLAATALFTGPFMLSNGYFFENTVQVIAPSTNSNCTGGQAVVSLGTHSAGPIIRNLYDSSNQFDTSAPLIYSSFPITSQHEPGTDNILIKLKDGSLLAIRNGITWEPASSKPDWWDHVTIQGHPNGSRVGAFVWHSTDCGQTWNRLSIIDPINYDNGRYAVPRPNETGCPSGCYGGWDRTEAYTDPWTGYVYVTVNAAGGPIIDYATNSEIQPARYTHFLFRSMDNGQTWESIYTFGAWTPIVMTSTPNGRLFLYTVTGNQPKLIYSLLDTEPMQFGTAKPINYWVEQDGVKTNIPAGADPIYSALVYKATNSISRISTDTSSSKVRLSYQWVNDNGKTAIAVVNVEVPDNNSEPVVTPVSIFYAADPENSTLSSSFIDPDPIGATVARTNTSVLYWVEGSTDHSRDAYARYSIFEGETGVSLPKIIGGPYKPTVSVAHYMYGGSFFPLDGSFNYLLQWVQENGIYANIITIPPRPEIKPPEMVACSYWCPIWEDPRLWIINPIVIISLIALPILVWSAGRRPVTASRVNSIRIAVAVGGLMLIAFGPVGGLIVIAATVITGGRALFYSTQ